MKYLVTLFNDGIEAIEGKNQKEALSKAKLDGANSWMVIKCEPLIKLTRNLNEVVMESLGLKRTLPPYSKKRVEKFQSLDGNKFKDPQDKPVIDCYKVATASPRVAA